MRSLRAMTLALYVVDYTSGLTPQEIVLTAALYASPVLVPLLMVAGWRLWRERDRSASE